MDLWKPSRSSPRLKSLFYVFMVLLAYSVFSYFFLFFPISRLSQSEITKIRSNPVGSGQELLTSFFFLCVYVGVMTSPCYLIIKLIPISRLVSWPDINCIVCVNQNRSSGSIKLGNWVVGKEKRKKGWGVVYSLAEITS